VDSEDVEERTVIPNTYFVLYFAQSDKVRNRVRRQLSQNEEPDRGRISNPAAKITSLKRHSCIPQSCNEISLEKSTFGCAYTSLPGISQAIPHTIFYASETAFKENTASIFRLMQARPLVSFSS